ncbi:hypothetical protein SYNPS1DRAFT_31627 [Syncephalis pseudoplumigaleata]|uniref:Cleavage/polyadenylation specificity factor A subunit N-terminal domain-containing protein n=1 Tax=Syncephalis pseudoplumigaleata TaxID=1712513 RepID=A0A4P9YV12_9FUNG|nr:hypothetical protein SYNPS1DRAFT_31627 [Syncephalis pseudoplumigaleata]|eukprot:RKP22740.1 hypothetical protein SYNPS1DRAFT_31627 [Syncephalis pseudoplumigaleata]
MLRVACASLYIPWTCCYGPVSTRNLLQPSFASIKSISAIDLSPGEALFVVGGDMPSSSQPQLGVGYMNPLGEQRTKLEGHKATVTSLQFFPSGQGITSTAIVARGRNVLCEAREIATLVRYPCAINHIALVQDRLSTDTGTAEPPARLDPREVDTHDKIVVCAIDNGLLCGIQLGTRAKLFELAMPDHPHTPMTAVAMLDHWLMGGDSEGSLALFHVPTQQCKLVFRRNQTTISHIAVQKRMQEGRDALDAYRWWITTTDGQCYCVQLTMTTSSEKDGDDDDDAVSVNVVHELVGSELEGIVHLQLPIMPSSDDHAAKHQKIATVTADGILREYQVPLV